MKVFVDGKFVDEKKAVVSVFDHGLLYGDGVFEGIRAYNGRVLSSASMWTGFLLGQGDPAEDSHEPPGDLRRRARSLQAKQDSRWLHPVGSDAWRGYVGLGP